MKVDFAKLFNLAKSNERNILSGVSIVGAIISSYAWYKTGLKISKVIEEKEKEMELVAEEDKEAKKAVTNELFKEVAPSMIVPSLITLATIGMIIFENRVGAKEIAVLSLAYSTTKNQLKDTREKMQEVLGEKKAKQVEDAVAKKHLDQSSEQPSESKQIILTGDGDTLCKDYYSGRPFRSNAAKIQQAMNTVSHKLLTDMWVPLNEFYFLIGLEGIPLGDDIGWDVDDTMNGNIPMRFSSILDNLNTPCLCVEFDISPRPRRLKFIDG